jgi:hypothetical protein
MKCPPITVLPLWRIYLKFGYTLRLPINQLFSANRMPDGTLKQRRQYRGSMLEERSSMPVSIGEPREGHRLKGVPNRAHCVIRIGRPQRLPSNRQ